MAIIYTTRLNLPKHDIGEVGWGTTLNTGLQDADDRLFLSGAGDPDGVVTSHYVGQRYWDTTNEVWYTATASGVSNAWAVGADGLVGLSGGVVEVGQVANALSFFVDSFANLLADTGADPRRVIVADASDNNDADTLNGVAGSLTDVGNDASYITSWQSHMVLPILVGSDPVIINFGHELNISYVGETTRAYAQAFSTSVFFVSCCWSQGGNYDVWRGMQVRPAATQELTHIAFNPRDASSGTASVYWFAIGA